MHTQTNEAETRAEHIDPALRAAGWSAGQRAAPEIADYVLVYRNHKLAVIEAKRRALPLIAPASPALKSVRIRTLWRFCGGDYKNRCWGNFNDAGSFDFGARYRRHPP